MQYVFHSRVDLSEHEIKLRVNITVAKGYGDYVENADTYAWLVRVLHAVNFLVATC